jgi:hypothetical protein
MDVKIGNGAAQFPENEYINEIIFVAVYDENHGLDRRAMSPRISRR